MIVLVYMYYGLLHEIKLSYLILYDHWQRYIKTNDIMI